jgi:two-component system OmpR family sensor kinase
LLLAGSEQSDFLRLEPISLPDFVGELWSATTAGHDRRFELGHIPDLEALADPDRLVQALRNLIVNAVAHTTGPDGLVGLEVHAADGQLRFDVIDDGPGVPDAQRERVFERFHRTDEARDRAAGGAGLGLAIVRAIAEAHGGSVSASSNTTGRGARLQLFIPNVVAAHRATAAAVV